MARNISIPLRSEFGDVASKSDPDMNVMGMKSIPEKFEISGLVGIAVFLFEGIKWWSKDVVLILLSTQFVLLFQINMSSYLTE